MAVPNNNPYLQCQQLIELEQQRVGETVPPLQKTNPYGPAPERILVLEEAEKVQQPPHASGANVT